MTTNGSVASKIAIIGMACRFPGQVEEPEQFWELVSSGKVAIGKTPHDRFDIERYFSENPDDPGTTYSRQAGYIEQPYAFDADFFGISAAEALEMDPQQRWLLELCWTALEHAGLVPSELRGRRVGLFLTAGDVDYARRTTLSGDVAGITAYAKLGANRAVGVGRIAYLLGFQGPAIFIDTTCSSSLVAVHLAAQSLASGDCDLALAGGVNLILGPEETIGFARLRAMSPSDSCRSFDSRADGYIRGEGGGVVVLRRAADAVAANDRIDALIAGSAVNNDGASNGLTAPNGAAQEEVIRAALARAGALPEEVGYVEAHGTGTPLGDPVELAALRNVYGAAPGRSAPLLLGAVKAQIGHLEAGAGIAGLLKAVMVQAHRRAPAQANFDEPNPRFRWEHAGLEVARTARDLAEDAPFVGLSSFGLSGTNAHLLLARTPSAPEPSAPTSAVTRVLPFSARSEAALGRLAERYARQLGRRGESIRDLCFTASARREHWDHRVAVVGRTPEDFIGGISEFVRNEPSGRWHARAQVGRRKLVFLFPGQGGWRPGVGSALYEKNRFYRAEIDTCLSLLPPGVAARVRAALLDRAPESLGHEPGQLAHFIVLHSLARMWLNLGLEPDAVVGHSLGEHAAAVIAGAMSLEDGLAAVEARGRLFAELAPPGAMLAVGAGQQRLREMLELGADLFVAAVNAPEQTVISGTSEAVSKAEALLKKAAIRTSAVPTYGTPGHSPLLEPLLDPFRRVLADLHFDRPRIEFVSSVTGDVAGNEIGSAEYWLDLVHKPVLFEAALGRAVGDGPSVCLEVGPGSVLANLARVAAPDAAVVTTLADGPDGDATAEEEAFAHACAGLYCAGVSLDWKRLYGGARPPAKIPTYSFEPTQFELPNPRGRPAARASIAPFPGRPVTSAPGDMARRSEGEISPQRPAWLRDHVVMDRLICPGAALLLAAARFASDPQSPQAGLSEVTLSYPLVLDAPRVVHVAIEEGKAPVQVSVHSRPADDAGAPWVHHLSAQASGGSASLEPLVPPTVGQPEADAAPLYDEAELRGLRLANDFRRVRSISAEEGWASAIIAPRGDGGETLSESDLDSAFQAAALILIDEFAGFPVPVALGELRLCGSPKAAAELRVISKADRGGTADVRSVDFDCYCGDELIISARALQFRDSATLSMGAPPERLFCREQWVPLPPSTKADPDEDRTQLILTPDAAALSSRGPGRWSYGIGAERTSADYRQLFGQIALAGADLTILVNGDDGGPAERAMTACGRLLGFYQALLAEEKAPRQVTLVTQSSVQVTSEDVRSLPGAAVRGLVRTLARETPGWAWRMIDADEPFAIEAVASAPGGADLAVRGGRWYERSILAEGPPPATQLSVEPDRWHVIFGAFGAIGLSVADWLYRQGARRILLAGRSVPGTIDRTRFAGAEIRAEQCDVVDAERVEAMLDSTEATAPLGYVFHCAAHLDDGLAAAVTPERNAAILLPKIVGSWVLHEATKERPIRQLVLFGSIAGWIGNPGQAVYAAANEFLEGLARFRRQHRLPALSVAWGLWEQTSADVGDDMVSRWSRRGLTPLSAEEAGDALGSLLAADLSNRLVARIDAARFFSDELPRGSQANRVDMRATDADGRDTSGVDVMRRVTEVAGAVSGRAQDLDGDTALTSLGFDSLALMEFRARLQQVFGRAAPVGLFMGGASLRKLAEFYGAGQLAAPAAAASEPAQDVVEVIL